MDDFVLWGNSAKELKLLLSRIEEFMGNRLKLELKPGGVWINKTSHGLSFLGMRIFPGVIRVRSENRRRSLKRFSQRAGEWKKGDISDEKMIQSLTSIIGHLRYFCRRMPITDAV